MTPHDTNEPTREEARSDGGGHKPPDARGSVFGPPRVVTRGESTSGHNPNPDLSLHSRAALIDWLNVTFPLPNQPDLISFFLDGLTSIIGPVFSGLISLNRGHNGWTTAHRLGTTDALFAIGGQNGTAFLSFTGACCSRISDESWEELMHFLGADFQGRITRVDLAHDDYLGIRNLESAVQQLELGEFNSGGRAPKPMQHGNWLTPDSRGRTLEIGRRKNGKLLRIYEKGKQLGDPESSWVRWELGLHNIDRVVPWDVLVEPGKYLAGAYPATRWIADEMCRIETKRKADSITEESLIQAAKNSFGQLFNHLLIKEGNEKAVFRKCRRGSQGFTYLPCVGTTKSQIRGDTCIQTRETMGIPRTRPCRLPQFPIPSFLASAVKWL